jgi:hypothetical protein
MLMLSLDGKFATVSKYIHIQPIITLLMIVLFDIQPGDEVKQTNVD